MIALYIALIGILAGLSIIQAFWLGIMSEGRRLAQPGEWTSGKALVLWVRSFIATSVGMLVIMCVLYAEAT